MEELSVKEIVKAVQGKLICGRPSQAVTGVSTDTRTIQPGDLFFALQGENADGHKYIGRAIASGAGGLILSDEESVPADCKCPAIKVDHPLWALGDLAKHYRDKFKVKVIGITGSVGKTTTKEMLASILERKWKVLKNAMNYNNEIGVPLTIFQMDRSHEVVILELAMRGLGEIRRLASIARPDVGVITNVGISHIERLGSQGAIADAKAEILSELPTHGLAVLNAEDCYYTVMCDRYHGRVLSFGSCKGADVIATRIKASKSGNYQFVLLVDGGAVEIKLPVLGQHNVYNALAASAAAVGLGVDLPTVRDGLQAFAAPSMRMELMKCKAGYAILNDAYNASPASMVAALRTLDSLAGYKRKIAILGDMLELGNYSSRAHKDVGNEVTRHKVDMLVTVGGLAKEIAQGAKDAGFPEDSISCYGDSTEAGEKLKAQVISGDAVLVKGSRAVKMEEIVRALNSD